MSTSLPDEVFDFTLFTPLVDLLLPQYRAKLPNVSIGTRIAQHQPFPAIVLRQIDDWGRAHIDERFVQTRQLVIHCFCDGLNAEEDADILAEAAHNILHATVNQVVAGKGHVTKVGNITLPHQSPDWATTTGPVQYANLPDGVIRQEAKYEVSFRRPV